MTDSDPAGSDWTGTEIDLIIADYFDMLRLARLREPYVKAKRNAALQALTRRSRGSIEFKHQNISAVLLKLGMDWIPGYKPMANFQAALIDGIERYLNVGNDAFTLPDAVAVTGMMDEAPIFLEPPPLVEVSSFEPAALTRLVRKFDPAARDARNRVLGKRGEERVLVSEQARLRSEDRPDLARKVRWVAQEDGDGAGYDVLSFDGKGEERLLEVKTTIGHQTTPFYLSENERMLSIERPDSFRVVRLYSFARSPRGFELVPPLDAVVMLKPSVYRATFGD